MISVSITKDNAKYKKIVVSGHALYDDYGKDIVCSAVSSITTTTINGILSLDKDSLSYEVNEDGLKIIINSDDNVTQTLIQNMINLLRELESNYPANVKVK
jgi:uncharacterized protein YsxB (DUF464 family)